VVSELLAYTLPTYVENGRVARVEGGSLTGNELANKLTGSTGNDTLSGGGGVDRLFGGAGADTLNGGAGTDTLEGGTGSDVYVMDGGYDLIFEPGSDPAAGGNDLLITSTEVYLPFGIERLTLTGAKSLKGYGNDLNNVITGNAAANLLVGFAGADTLIGGGGADTLSGNAGNDVLTGGPGSDFFVFYERPGSTNVERITDFKSGEDDILFYDDLMTGLKGTSAPVALPASQYKLVTSGTGFSAGDADDRIIYNTTTDALYYDPDGSGRAAAIKIATVVLAGTAHPLASDFLVLGILG